MADESRDRQSSGDDRPAFGWANARRRLGAEGAKQSGPGEPPAAPQPPAQENARLRPSGQLQRPMPQGRTWGEVESIAPPPGIPGQPRMSAVRTSPGAPAEPPGSRELQRPEPMRPAPRPVESLGGAKGANPQAEAAKIRLHELLIEELEHGALEGLAP